MSQSGKCSILSSLAFIAFSLFVFNAYGRAAELPAQWPWKGVSMGFPDASPSDIKRYKDSLNVSVVRLQLKARQHAHKNKLSAEVARQEAFVWADKMLDECAKQGVLAIINVSHFPIDATKPSQRTEEFWSNDASRSDAILEVNKTVNHFKGRGAELIAYDFMSEPVLQKNGGSFQPPKWPKMLSEIVGKVRAADAERWLIVAPGPWGGPDGYKNFKVPHASRLILGVHMYAPQRFTHQVGKTYTYPGIINLRNWDKQKLRNSLVDLREISSKNGLPVLVGEFGAVRWADGGEQYLMDLASIFDESGWGWLYFSASGWHGWDPDYSRVYPGKDGDMKWKENFVGDKSERWKTLHSIFDFDVKREIK